MDAFAKSTLKQIVSYKSVDVMSLISLGSQLTTVEASINCKNSTRIYLTISNGLSFLYTTFLSGLCL